MKPVVIVAGDFVKTGGMDRANFALAEYLAKSGRAVELVTHRADATLNAHENLRVHRVPRPFGSDLAGEPLLDWMGRGWAARARERGGRVVVNGGNCLTSSVNWVHYLHAAYSPPARELVYGLKDRLARRRFLSREAKALSRARLVICNSNRTCRDVSERIPSPARRVETVYYGIDPTIFFPPSSADRRALRARLGLSDRPTAVFLGSPTDPRKGFDRVAEAFQQLRTHLRWDVELVVVGRAIGALLVAGPSADRIRFLGFRTDVPAILRACDLLISPVRYEAYGLGIQEALACGVPALVSRAAGVAERFPTELESLLLPDPENVADLIERLLAWRENIERFARHTLPISESLRQYTWDHMAERIVQLIDGERS